MKIYGIFPDFIAALTISIGAHITVEASAIPRPDMEIDM